jgi:hypothetical protein
MSIIRNTDGFSALASSHPLANLDFTNPLKWSMWMEDFHAYDIAQTAGNPYTLTQTNCVDTITGPNGILVLTLGGADNDVGQLQLTENPWKITSGKQLYMQARLKLTLASGGTVAANEMFIGLASEQTTTNFMNAGGTALAVDDCLGFVKYDATGTMAAVSRATDVESTDAGIITPVDATFFTVAVYYDGTKSKFYAGSAADGSDMVLKSTLTGSDPSGVMTPTFYIKGGEAKANVLSVDYLMIASER